MLAHIGVIKTVLANQTGFFVHNGDYYRENVMLLITSIIIFIIVSLLPVIIIAASRRKCISRYKRLRHASTTTTIASQVNVLTLGYSVCVCVRACAYVKQLPGRRSSLAHRTSGAVGLRLMAMATPILSLYYNHSPKVHI